MAKFLAGLEWTRVSDAAVINKQEATIAFLKEFPEIDKPELFSEQLLAKNQLFYIFYKDLKNDKCPELEVNSLQASNKNLRDELVNAREVTRDLRDEIKTVKDSILQDDSVRIIFKEIVGRS